MQPLISQLLLNNGLKDLRRLHTPAQNLRTQSETVRIHSLLGMNGLVLPKLLEVGVTRPRRVRQDVTGLGDIFEAGIAEPVAQQVIDIHEPTRCMCAGAQSSHVLHKRRRVLESAVIAPAPNGAFFDFKVSAWLEVVVDSS